MHPSILCRERLERIQRILNRVGGSLTVREFQRTYSVHEWEVEQAARAWNYAKGRVELHRSPPHARNRQRNLAASPRTEKLPSRTGTTAVRK
jgi:hypothetical protein